MRRVWKGFQWSVCTADDQRKGSEGEGKGVGQVGGAVKPAVREE